MNPEHEHGLTDDAFHRLTAAVRDADNLHQTTGGGTRHWLRDCLFGALEEHGLRIIDVRASQGDDDD